ncbi:MAG: hypothetical protein KGS72_23555 [Cyanobacteria bacterium REEB67]|nr:hypothetical protein [Cyanobacteria bacterium REEB67]
MFGSLTTSLALTSALAVARACAQSPGPVYPDQMTNEYNQGRYAAAEQTGLTLLRSEPSNLAVHYLLGNIYLKTARTDRAVQEYNYCRKFGNGSQIGVFASQGLEQIRQGLPKTTAPDVQSSPISPSPAAPAPITNLQAQTAPAKIDLEMLEYKERLLETGANLIAANRAKLQRQIQSLQNQTEGVLETMTTSASSQRGGSNQLELEKNRLEQETATKIQELRDNNAAEELKITAFYKSQVDAIGQQKADLGSQMEKSGCKSGGVVRTNGSKTDAETGNVRLVERGSGLFVRNYINYHGEMPLPPLPPELHALAQKMTDTSPNSASGKKSVRQSGQSPTKIKAGKQH